MERILMDKQLDIRGDRVADLLLADGKVTRGQLDEARRVQIQDHRDLSDILLSLGYIGKEDLAKAMARKLRLKYVEVAESSVDPQAAAMLDRRILRKHGVVPLRVEEGHLVVATSSPSNFYMLEDLAMLSGYPITPVVALQEDIERVLNRVFTIKQEVAEIFEGDGAGPAEVEPEIELGVEARPDEAPIIRLVTALLQRAVTEGASDIHVEPRPGELMVRFRVDGVLREAMSVPPGLRAGMVSRLKIMADLDIAERRVPQDGRFSVKLRGRKIDLREATLPTVFGERVVLRLLDAESVEMDLSKLGFPPKVLERYEEVFRRPYGTILVAGPTGSGKSTTLYATLAELNSPETNIITVEDPVEFRLAGVNQVQVNTKAGLTFASGLRSILRSDPDVVMIGEIRDYETAKTSVEAALTGHLVLATLHTNDAPSAVSRLTEMGVEPYLTATAVDCVIAQRLARRLCERCKRPVEIEREILEALNFPFELVGPEEEWSFHKAAGCDRCGGTGYRGRIGIYEMMLVDEELKETILRRGSVGELVQIARRGGMVSLRDDALVKAASGVSTIEEVLKNVV
jgi:type IV pilus assembly protein PilB